MNSISKIVADTDPTMLFHSRVSGIIVYSQFTNVSQSCNNIFLCEGSTSTELLSDYNNETTTRQTLDKGMDFPAQQAQEGLSI